MMEAGYSATEVGGTLATDPIVLRQELEKRDMTPCGAYLPLTLDQASLPAIDEHRLSERLLFLSSIGCDHLIVACESTPERVSLAGHVPDNDGLTDVGWRHLGMNLEYIGRRSTPLGISVHFHNHVGTLVETPQEVERLVDVLPIPWVDLCFDTGHYVYGGGEPARFFEAHRDLIRYLHVKDVDQTVLDRCRQKRLGFDEALRQFVFCELGQGSVGIEHVLGLLIDHGYSGWIVVEQDTTPHPPTESARRNREYLRRVFNL